MEELMKELNEALSNVEGLDVGDVLTRMETTFNALKVEKEKVNKKNNELLGKQKELKTKLAEDEVLRVDYTRLKEEEEERTENPTNTNEDVQVELEKLTAKLERKHQLEIDKYNTIVSEKDERITKQDNEINGGMIKDTIAGQLANGVPVMDAHSTLLKGYFSNYAEVVINDDGEREVKMRDAYGNAPDYLKDENGRMKAEEYLEYWKSTDTAKAYLQAPVTDGGGAKPTKGKVIRYTKLSEVPFSARIEMANTDPAQYERLKKADNN